MSDQEHVFVAANQKLKTQINKQKTKKQTLRHNPKLGNKSADDAYAFVWTVKCLQILAIKLSAEQLVLNKCERFFLNQMENVINQVSINEFGCIIDISTYRETAHIEILYNSYKKALENGIVLKDFVDEVSADEKDKITTGGAIEGGIYFMFLLAKFLQLTNDEFGQNMRDAIDHIASASAYVAINQYICGENVMGAMQKMLPREYIQTRAANIVFDTSALIKYRWE